MDGALAGGENAARSPTPASPERAARYGRGWAIAAAVVLLVALGLLLWQSFRQIRDALASPGWPTAAGTILTSEVDRHWRHLPKVHEGTYHELDLAYGYSVAGRSYRGTTVSLGRHRAGVDHMRRIAARYPVGSAVTVFHKPDEPSRAVLEPGLDAPGLLNALGALMFFELVFLLPAFVGCVWASRHFARLARS